MIQRIQDRIYELINALHEQSTYQVSKIISFLRILRNFFISILLREKKNQISHVNGFPCTLYERIGTNTLFIL